MNFGRRNVEKLQRSLTSRSVKRMRRLGLSMIHLGIVAVIGAGILLLCLGIGAFRGVLDTAPDIGHIDVTPSGFSTFVYDKDGRQIAKLVSTNANRIPVTMDMVPDQLGKAFVAIEDQRFFEHKGIDIYGIIRAGVIAVQSRSLSQGASTITQQLLKNNVFTTWTSESGNMDRIRRKIQEQYLAIELEKQMDKDVILLNYMNTINLGHNTLGVQAASLRYFGKSVSDLTLSECAVIAAITQNPTAFDPIAYPENNERRRKDVLDRMLAQEFISQEDYDEAMEDDVYSRIKIVDDATPDEEVNTYFVDALTDQVLEDLLAAGYTEGQAYTLLYSGGLSIFSTQDSEIQKIADDVCSDPNTYPAGAQLLLDYALTVQAEDGTLTNYSDEMMTLHFRETNSAYTPYFDTEEAADAAIEQYKQDVMGPGDTVLAENKTLTIQPQISLTIEDQHTGHVVAMVGGRGKKIASRTLNRATSSMRQPGSTFKIVAVYAPALDASDLSLAYTQLDAPYQYEDGTPVRNWYGEAYRGLQSLRMGIQESLNIVAVKTLTYITPQLGYEYAVDLGISTLANGDVVGDQVFYDARQPLGLGGITYGVKNIELNGAYATVANDGVYIKPKLYTRITDHEGNVILDTNDYPERRVLKSSTAWLLTNAMQDVVTKGTGASVNWGTTAIAGKTGTTSDYNDVWFSGYTNYYTATTWVGCDDNKKLSTSDEKALARTLWRKVMEKVHENLEPATFGAPPSSVTTKTVCALSGLLPIPGVCDATLKTEYFAADNVPKDTCDVHFHGNICEATGLPATPFCPFQIANGAATLSDHATLTSCPHTAEYMSQPNIQELIAMEQAQIDQNRILASLEQYNILVQNCAQVVAQCQQQLEEARASGDPGRIAEAEAVLTQALLNYETAVAQQQEAVNNALGG